MSIFDNWSENTDAGKSIFRKGQLYGAIVAPLKNLSGPELAAEIIQLAGETFGSEFYKSWNGFADVHLFQNADSAILAVMDMRRPGDDYDAGGDDSLSDQPTFAWKKDGESLVLVASQGWRDVSVVEALGSDWPARESFESFGDVQGWGE